MPTVSPALVAAGASTGSYAREVSPGIHRSARDGSAARAGAAAYVIDTGHRWPASTWDHTMNPAARRAWAPLPDGRAHGSAVSPWPTATSMSRW